MPSELVSGSNPRRDLVVQKQVYIAVWIEDGSIVVYEYLHKEKMDWAWSSWVPAIYLGAGG